MTLLVPKPSIKIHLVERPKRTIHSMLRANKRKNRLKNSTMLRKIAIGKDGNYERF